LVSAKNFKIVGLEVIPNNGSKISCYKNDVITDAITKCKTMKKLIAKLAAYGVDFSS